MGLYELFRHDFTIYKAASVTDTSRIPASGVLIDIYREGATAQGAGSDVGAGATITVHDPGRIVAGDTVVVGTGTVTRTVASITATSIILTAGGGGTFSWADGDRIIPTNTRPLTYTDDTGIETTAVASQLTTSSLGEGFCYTRSPHVEAIANDGGSKTLISDITGGGGREHVSPFEWGGRADGATDDSGALADALEYLAAVGGGVLRLPPGNIRLGSTITLSALTNLSIVGAGRGVTELQINHAGIGLDLTGACTDIAISGLRIRRLTGTADHIQIGSSCSRISLEDIIFNGGGLGVDDHGTDTRINKMWFIGGSWTTFVRLDAATRPHITSLIARSTGVWTRGIDIDTGTTSARLNNVDIAPAGAVSTAGGIGIHIRDTGGATDPRDIIVQAAHLVGGTGTGTSPGVVIDAGQGIQFDSCTVEDSSIGYDLNQGNGVLINGGFVIGIQTHGIDVANALTFLTLQGVMLSDCSQSSTTTFHFVNIGNNVVDCAIYNLSFGNYIRGGATQCGNVIRVGTAVDRMQFLGIHGQLSSISGGQTVSGGQFNGQTSDLSHCVDVGTSTYTHTSPVAGALASATANIIGVKEILDGSTTTNVQNVHTLSLNQSGSVVWLGLTGSRVGQTVKIVNLSGAFTATFNDGGNFALGANRVLGQNDTLTLHAMGGDVWAELAFGNN